MYSLFGEKIIDKMTLHPAKMFGLFPEKGIISEASDADFFIYNEKPGLKVTENHSECDYSLYTDIAVNGNVQTTVCGGSVIMNNGTIYPRKGRFIARDT